MILDCSESLVFNLLSEHAINLLNSDYTVSANNIQETYRVPKSNQIKLVEPQMIWLLRFDLFSIYYSYAVNVKTLQSFIVHTRSITINRVTRNFSSHQTSELSTLYKALDKSSQKKLKISSNQNNRIVKRQVRCIFEIST